MGITIIILLTHRSYYFLLILIHLLGNHMIGLQPIMDAQKRIVKKGLK